MFFVHAISISMLLLFGVAFYYLTARVIAESLIAIPSKSVLPNPPERTMPDLHRRTSSDSSGVIGLQDRPERAAPNVQTASSHLAARRLYDELTTLFLWFILGSLLILGIALVVTERWIVLPVHRLQAQVQSLQKNMYAGSRLDTHRRDEIGEIAESINALMLHGETARLESLQARTLIEQIVKSSGVGIVALNHRGHLLILNQRLEELLGCSRDEVELHGWFETIYRKEDERAAAIERWKKQLTGKVSCSEEWQLDTGKGGKQILAVITVPLHKPQGEAIGTISFCHDVSKQKQLENQVEQSRRLASLGTLAGGIAHNFNNILCAILGYTTLGRERLPKGDPVRDYFAIIEQSATRASQLTQQLLLFSKGSQGAMQLVDLRPLIHEVVSLLRENFPKNIVIEEIYQQDWLFLEADSGQLHQCLMNICLNARDAMPGGGRLTIESSLQNYEAGSLPAGEMAPGSYVRLEIKDTGSGMSDEVKQRLFEPFFTTKAPGKGTGLGLATVYGSIKSHHGHIEVRSQVGRGTSFILYLPALKDLFGEEIKSDFHAYPKPPSITSISPPLAPEMNTVD
jgi:PAS domain S-box-containing protein